MEKKASLSAKWTDYRPSKAGWFWSCVACVVLTMIVGFGFGSWVTHGAAASMTAQAVQQAQAQLAAAYCVSRFDFAPDAAAKLAALKSTDSWQRSEFIDKGGWAKLPGVAKSVDGAAELCARKLVSASSTPAKPATTSG